MSPALNKYRKITLNTTILLYICSRRYFLHLFPVLLRKDYLKFFRINAKKADVKLLYKYALLGTLSFM